MMLVLVVVRQVSHLAFVLWVVSPSLLYEHVFIIIFRVRYDINGPPSHFDNEVSNCGKDKLLGLAYIYTT